MLVRGAPLIGVTGAYGFVLGLRMIVLTKEEIVKQLIETRPTAVNLKWALNRMSEKVKPLIQRNVWVKLLKKRKNRNRRYYDVFLN